MIVPLSGQPRVSILGLQQASACRMSAHTPDKLSNHGPSLRGIAALVLAISLSMWSPLSTEAKGLDLSVTPLGPGEAKFVLEGRPRVVDGDTLVFEEKNGMKEKVRLLGIDAPESKQLCKNRKGAEYKCGLESKAYLETVIGKDPVQCLAKKRDMYSRVLGVCFDQKSGVDLNKLMVEQGEAVAYRQYSKAYAKDEDLAHDQRKGIWDGEFQIPAEWRKERRSKPKSTSPKAPSGQDQGSSGSSTFVISTNSKIKVPKAEFPDPDEDLLD